MIAAGRALAAAVLLPATAGMAPTLDGLRLIGGSAHTDREFAVVDSMVPRFYLLSRMITELSKGPKGP